MPPTGSLKHRLARSLFPYALSNGWLGPHSTVVEARSGSIAVSEAYFARRLCCVLQESTSRAAGFDLPTYRPVMK